MDDTKCIKCQTNIATLDGFCNDCSIFSLPCPDSLIESLADYETERQNPSGDLMNTTTDQTDNTYFENWSNQELVEVSHFMSHYYNDSRLHLASYSYFYYNDCSFKDFATHHEVLLAFNIRSIPTNLDSFIDEYHEVMKTNLSIICFTETWYKDHNIDLFTTCTTTPVHMSIVQLKWEVVSLFL